MSAFLLPLLVLLSASSSTARYGNGGRSKNSKTRTRAGPECPGWSKAGKQDLAVELISDFFVFYLCLPVGA